MRMHVFQTHWHQRNDCKPRIWGGGPLSSSRVADLQVGHWSYNPMLWSGNEALSFSAYEHHFTRHLHNVREDMHHELTWFEGFVKHGES